MKIDWTRLFFCLLTIGECDWKAGGLSGCVYNVDPEVTTLVTQVYGMSAWTNPDVSLPTVNVYCSS